MAETPVYRTAPLNTPRMPPGVGYIVGNEAAERFSFYGMKTILTVFMAQHLRDAGGNLAVMSEADARQWYHVFNSAVYATPFVGALLSDTILGKYRTIVTLSVVYCLGHLALAVDETRTGLLVGLTLIAIGSGGIKPCVSAHVGDQFGQGNQHLVDKVFGWFYWSINFGSFFSTLLTPWLLEHHGPHVAFGVPGALMLIATWVFWLGRRDFAHVPPGGRAFLGEAFGPAGLAALKQLLPLYAFIAIFWALYDQTGSAWVLQADHMDRRFLGVEWLSSQVQAINPILVLMFIPLFTYVLYPAVGRVVPLTALRKVGFGFFLTVLAFLLPAWVEAQILAGATPNIGWQIGAYVLLTAAEVMVYGTALEFSYTQAPNRMKSFIMALFLASVSVGNLLTAAVNALIQNADGSSKLAGASYYLFFAGLMFAAAVLFIPVAMWYKEKRYVQPAPGEPALSSI